MSVISRRTLLGAGAAALQATAQDAVRLGIIGLGLRSRAHLAALKKLPGGKLVALSDLDGQRMAAVNQGLAGSAAAYTDWRELVRDRNVQAVVIVAPNYLHHEMAIAALEAGKDVLLEKPIAISWEHARQVEKAARAGGRILAIGMQRHFGKPEAEARALVESGALGKVQLITTADLRGDWNPASWQFTDPRGKKTNWRYLRRTAGSSELEMSIHTLGFLQSIVNSPMARVSATGGTVHFSGRETRDLSSAIVDFANGARLSYSLCLFARGAGGDLTMVGDKASLRRSRGELQFLVDGKPQPAPAPANLPAGDAEVLMYTDFFDSVRRRRPPSLSLDVALEASKLAYAIDLSIGQGRIVTAADFA